MYLWMGNFWKSSGSQLPIWMRFTLAEVCTFQVLFLACAKCYALVIEINAKPLCCLWFVYFSYLTIVANFMVSVFLTSFPSTLEVMSFNLFYSLADVALDCSFNSSKNLAQCPLCTCEQGYGKGM